MSSKRLVWVGLLVLLVAGFFVYPRLRAAPEAPPTNGAQHAIGGTIPAAGAARGGAGAPHRPPIAVVTATAQSENVPVTASFVGTVEPVASVAVRPRIDGVILNVDVSEGQTVKAGDVLFRLDDRTIRAAIAKDQAAVAKDQATLTQAQADLTRVQTLLSHGDATAQQAGQQQAAVGVAEGSVASDKAQLQVDEVQLGYTTITAPIAGRVGQVNDSAGALVHASDSTPLLTITQMAPVYVSFQVPQPDLGAFRTALKAKQPAAVSVIDADTGKSLADGTLDFIDSAFDQSSGTVTAKAKVTNADEVLWPGEYVQVKAQLSTIANATVVPTIAVQLNGSRAFVFLVKPNATVAEQTVTVGEGSGDSTVITSGVKPGDQVVVEGQLHLAEGSPVIVPGSGTRSAAGKKPTAVD